MAGTKEIIGVDGKKYRLPTNGLYRLTVAQKKYENNKVEEGCIVLPVNYGHASAGDNSVSVSTGTIRQNGVLRIVNAVPCISLGGATTGPRAVLYVASGATVPTYFRLASLNTQPSVALGATPLAYVKRVATTTVVQAVIDNDARPKLHFPVKIIPSGS